MSKLQRRCAVVIEVMVEVVGQIFWYGFYIHLICINILGFFMYAYDKCQARRDGWRVPEARLLLVVLAGGGAGAVIHMMHAFLSWLDLT